jgi:hypothetical protein
MGVSSTGLHPGLFRFNPFGVGGYVCLCCLPPDHRISSGDIDVQPLRGWRVCGCVVDRLSFGLHPGLEGMWVCCWVIQVQPLRGSRVCGCVVCHLTACPPFHRIASGVIQVQPFQGWRVYVGMKQSPTT